MHMSVLEISFYMFGDRFPIADSRFPIVAFGVQGSMCDVPTVDVWLSTPAFGLPISIFEFRILQNPAK